MNTLTDAQLVVSSDVAALLDRAGARRRPALDAEARDAIAIGSARTGSSCRTASTTRALADYFTARQERHRRS